MTAPIGKTVIVLGGYTGPTGTFKQVNILPNFTGATGELPIWNAATGATGPNGTFKNVINIGPTGLTGPWKNVIIPGFSSGPVGSTWNPADKSAAITLTNTNNTASLASAVTDAVRGTLGKSAGKLYFEMNTILLSTSTDFAGLANSAYVLGNARGDANTASWSQDGQITVQGGALAAGVGSPNTHVLGIAVDFTNSKIWFRLDAGIWNNSGTANPTTNVGGFGYSAALLSAGDGKLYPCCRIDGNPTHVTLNTAGAFANAAPTGFTAWG